MPKFSSSFSCVPLQRPALQADDLGTTEATLPQIPLDCYAYRYTSSESGELGTVRGALNEEPRQCMQALQRLSKCVEGMFKDSETGVSGTVV